MNRIKTLSTLVTFFFFILFSKFFYLQIIKGQEIKDKATIQSYKLIKEMPQRGIIYSSDNFPIVLNQNENKIAIYKPELKNTDKEIIQDINNIYSKFIEENSKLIDIFYNPNQKWVEFSSVFNEDQISLLKKIPGINIISTKKRFYPEGSNFANHLIGKLAKNTNGNDEAYGGIEAYYNKQLIGRPGYSWTTRDATGKTILSQKSWGQQKKDGADIYTNINRPVQYLAEKYLKDGIEKFSADSGSITILDSKTGKVIALTSQEATSSSNMLKNRTIFDLIEPGSVFKPVVISIALQENKINKNYICTKCNQSRIVGQHSINNWDKNVHPDSTLFDIIKNSDNIGMSYIMSNIGKDTFLKYYSTFGLDQKTGIDLQGESRSPTKKSWPEIDLLTASFGQGFAINQVKMTQIFNTLTYGKYLQPKIVNYINSNNKDTYIKTNNETNVFNQETLNTIKEILKYGVENGAVNQFKDKNMEVCGKSGTAQVAIDGSYNNSSINASYVGFSPCQSPKFTMMVTINNPKSSSWGSSTAAPIWFDLGEIILNLI